MNKMTSRKLAKWWSLALCGVALSTLPMRAQSNSNPATPPVASAQPSATQQFEVAVIKPTTASSGSSSGIASGHGQIHGENVTLKRCILGAYGVGPHQIAGGPDWIDSERFDIQAKSDQPIDDDGVLMVMLQNLLADRFKLAFHREDRQISAFVLEIAKDGPKLEKATGGESVTNTQSMSGKTAGVMITVRNENMSQFAQILSRKMDLPVVNQTGLDGIFNLKLSWTPDNAKGSAEGVEDVSIFDALQKQLGLRLRKTKVPVETIVIDHVEKPSEN
jgi:uncharacterized protein (TIGR03435 family)